MLCSRRIANYGLELNGVDAYMNPGLVPNSTAGVVETRCRVLKQEGTFRMLFGQQDPRLLVAVYGNEWRAAFGDVSWNLTPVSPIPVRYRRRYHVALAWSGDNAEFLIDGEVVATVTNAAHSFVYPVVFGAHSVTGSVTNFLHCILEDVRIWNIYRTPEEIRSTMHKSIRGTTSGLVASYPFIVPTGVSAVDYSGNGNNAPITSPRWTFWDGPRGLLLPRSERTLKAINIL